MWTPIWWSSDNSERYGSFPTCDIIWLRVMFMVRDILRLELTVNLVSKPLNRVEKILNLVVVNSANRGFTVYVNSDMIFGMIFMMLSDSK